jgi:hypothetical protein
MRCITLITAAISVLAFVSQSASALPVQESHGEPSQLSKRQGPLGGLTGALDALDGLGGDGAGGGGGPPGDAGGPPGGAGGGPSGAK